MVEYEDVCDHLVKKIFKEMIKGGELDCRSIKNQLIDRYCDVLSLVYPDRNCVIDLYDRLVELEQSGIIVKYDSRSVEFIFGE